MKTVAELLAEHIAPEDAVKASEWLFAQATSLHAIGCHIGLSSVLMALVAELDSVQQPTVDNLGTIGEAA